MWLVMGWFFVALGAVGVVLPLLPTVPFLLLAVFCFERGSPKLHDWVMEHPQFGPPVKEWRRHRVIRPRAKLIACVGLAGSSAFTLTTDRPLFVKALVAGICLVVIVYILTRKSQP